MDTTTINQAWDSVVKVEEPLDKKRQKEAIRKAYDDINSRVTGADGVTTVKLFNQTPETPKESKVSQEYLKWAEDIQSNRPQKSRSGTFAHNPNDFVEVRDGSQKHQTLLAILQALTGGIVSTPFLQENASEALLEISRNKPMMVHRLGRWYDDLERYYRIIASRIEGLPNARTESPNWSNAIEEDTTVASVVAILGLAGFDYFNMNRHKNLVKKFFEAKGITSPEIQKEVLEILKNIFPKAEARLDRAFIEMAFDENYTPTEKEKSDKTVELL